MVVLATVHGCQHLVHGVVQHAPEVVVCDVPALDEDWFQAFEALGQTQPRPVVVFTHDTDAPHIARATECGVHVYVVQGYGAHRLQPLVALARARFVQVQSQRAAYAAIAIRLQERKVVDQAKGILMRAQQLSDDDAFGALRSAAMRSNQRMGQLSQQIVLSAQFADAVNRAGQLRMLSQRLVKLHLFQRLGIEASHHAALMEESAKRVDDNLAQLRNGPALPEHEGLLQQVAQVWEALNAEMVGGGFDAVNTRAEALLQGAEQLTRSLEQSGVTLSLQVLNLAGRQRMLSQRFAKCALLALADHGGVAASAQADMRAAQQAFESALTYLNGIALRTPEIDAALGAAGVAWLQMVDAAKQVERSVPPQRQASLQALAQGSEGVLALFEQLSVDYERSMQMLIG
jgi:AmiR/NasT family two-component response regulator